MLEQCNNLDLFCYTVNPLLILFPVDVKMVGTLPLYNTFQIIKTMSPLSSAV